MATKKKPFIKKETVVRIPFRPSYPPSEEQKPILQDSKFGDESIHTDATAGSGKSTVLKWAMTMEPHDRACCLSMGREIANEIEPHCPPHVDVNTVHGFGRRAIVDHIRRQPFLNNAKVRTIFKDLFPSKNPELKTGKDKSAAYSFLYDVSKLVDLLRINLRDENSRYEIERTINQYNIAIENVDEVAMMLPLIYQKMLENVSMIDFTDMMWLPIRLNLKVPQYPMMYVDERQDLNSLMIEYIFRMSTDRIMTVGDEFQSIMGFAGADLNSTKRLLARFAGNEYPLNTCYRCGKLIIELAKTICPRIVAFDGAIDGEVIEAEQIDLEMPDGSMVLSRRNANLVKPCFAMLRAGRKAIIKGKDIGEALISLIEGLKASDPIDLIDKVETYRDKRIEKISAKEDCSQSQIDKTNDECQCVIEIASSCKSIEEIIDRIRMIFDNSVKGVTFSSIHRSKGLEADEVTIIDYNRIRLNNEKMSEEDHIQERNLHFVAVTRAKKKLTLIH